MEFRSLQSTPVDTSTRFSSNSLINPAFNSLLHQFEATEDLDSTTSRAPDSLIARWTQFRIESPNVKFRFIDPHMDVMLDKAWLRAGPDDNPNLRANS